ncbi:hypothetical protein A9253_03965 [Streptococcus agalactiae serogroup III]|nr:hypothetical protein A9253_03965 [Streptococcus agalactiae serogroup III]
MTRHIKISILNLQNEGEGTMEILIAGGSGFLGKQIIKASGLDYLFVRPGLMYGEERPLSIFQAKCIKLFSHLPFLGIVVQKVFPTKVVIVAEAIVTSLRKKPTQKILSIEELNNK